MWARIWPTRRPWCSLRKRPVSASRSAGSFWRSRPRASSASTSGSVSAGDERVEQPPHRDTERLRGDARDLDPCVLQDLVEPLHLAASLLDLRLAIAGQVPELADR